MNIGVVYTAYRRAEMVQKTLAAIMAADDSNTFPYFLSLDGPPDDVAESRTHMEKFTEKMGNVNRNHVHFQVHPSRIGCPLNTVESIQQACKSFRLDALIHIEDDVLVSRDYFTFMRQMLEMFKDDKRVWSVDGDNEDWGDESEKKVDALRSNAQFITIGWATWIDRWITFFNYWIKEGFYAEKVWSWDFSMDDCRILNKGVRVYPEQARSTHIGWYGTNLPRAHAEMHDSTPDTPCRRAVNWEEKHDVWESLEIEDGSISRAASAAELQKPRGPDITFSTDFRGNCI